MNIVKFNESRWKIVDDNGKTLDDAQGYGFKTKDGALKCWNYKQNRKEIEAFKHTINNWWDKNKETYDYITDTIWISIHDCTPLKTNEIVNILKDYIDKHEIEKPKGIHTWQLVKYMK